MNDLEPISNLMLIMLGVGLGLLVVWWAALPHRPHHYGGAYGVTGGLERWQHGSYRWRRVLEAAVMIGIIVLLAPWTLEIVVGAGMMALGVLWLALWALRPRRHPFAGGFAIGGLMGWLLGHRRH